MNQYDNYSFFKLCDMLKEAFRMGFEQECLAIHSELRTRISESTYHENGIDS